MTTSVDAKNPVASGKVFIFPASFGQKRIWPQNPSQSIYNMPDAVRVLGPLDVEALRRSVREVVRRHESLRTRFLATNGEISQIIETEVEVEVPVVDLGSESLEMREGAARRLIQKEINAPFDLQSVPLWRVKLFHLGDQDHIVVLVLHHIISDGWSMGVMLREVSLLYSAFVSGQPSPLPELPLQYADFSEWERESMQGKAFEKELAYWKAHLSGTTALNLPYDRPKLSPSYSGRGGSYGFRVEGRLAEKLRSLTQQQNASLNMTLLAVYQTLLYRYSGQQDIVVGCIAARRNWPAVQGIIGYFANPLVIRTRLSGEWSFYQLLVQVKEITIAAYERQHIPFYCVLQELAPEHDPNRPSIYQTMFNLQNFPPYEFRLGTAAISHFEIDFAPARMDISVFATDTGEIIPFAVLYDQDLFNPETISSMFQYYVVLSSEYCRSSRTTSIRFAAYERP